MRCLVPPYDKTRYTNHCSVTLLDNFFLCRSFAMLSSTHERIILKNTTLGLTRRQARFDCHNKCFDGFVERKRNGKNKTSHYLDGYAWLMQGYFDEDDDDRTWTITVILSRRSARLGNVYPTFPPKHQSQQLQVQPITTL